MPKLIKAERVPITMSQVMKNSLDNTWSPEVVENWRNNYWDTGDGSVRYTNGSGIMLHDADYLRELNPKTRLTPNRAVALGNRTFTPGKNGLYLPQDRIAQIHGVYLTADQAKDSPEWQFLARESENPGLLGEFVDTRFRIGKERHGYTTMMALIFGSPEAETSGRSWSLDDVNNRSNAYGNVSVDHSSGRLVGVAPEALGAQKNILHATLEDRIPEIRVGQPFKFQGKMYRMEQE
ncbi:MAG: hypothetical protein ABIJ21_08105 [Nanoarchaeota archaeon]